jgi:osmotically-inducible protein OsmY
MVVHRRPRPQTHTRLEARSKEVSIMNTTATTLSIASALGLMLAAWTPAVAQQQGQQTQSPPRQRQGQPQQQPKGTQAQSPESRGGIADSALENRIVRRLAERLYVGQNFSIDAQQGTVTVGGTVPSEDDKLRALRIVRRTLGVTDVQDRLRIDAAADQAQSTPAIGEAELSKRVAQKIAAAIPGAKAGEDWWFTGWRVEGPANDWNLVVQADENNIVLEGELWRESILRKAVEAALQVPGVMSVRSNVDLEPFERTYYGYPYYGYHPYAAYPHAYPYYGYVPDYPSASPADN